MCDLDKITYQQLSRQYMPANENWFKESYKVFISTQSPIRKHDLIKLIAFAYSWMPTIPNLNNASEDIWAEILKYINQIQQGKDENLERLLLLLVPIINNSIVGTSKVLHFVSPHTIPIIDSRVIKAWNKIFAARRDLRLKGVLVTRDNVQKVVVNYLEYRSNMFKWKKACGNAVTLRDIESMLYYQELST